MVVAGADAEPDGVSPSVMIILRPNITYGWLEFGDRWLYRNAFNCLIFRIVCLVTESFGNSSMGFAMRASINSIPRRVVNLYKLSVSSWLHICLLLRVHRLEDRELGCWRYAYQLKPHPIQQSKQ